MASNDALYDPNSPIGGLSSLGPSASLSTYGGETGKARRRSSRRSESSEGIGGPAPAQPIGSDAVAQPAPAITANPAERQSARDLLTSIGQKFAENRQKSKSKAFEIYQRDLATNSGALVMGGAVTLKELTVLLMDLESFVKSSQKEGETPATLLAQFLRGELEVND